MDWMDIIRFHLVIFVIVVVCWFFLFLIINGILLNRIDYFMLTMTSML